MRRREEEAPGGAGALRNATNSVGEGSGTTNNAICTPPPAESKAEISVADRPIAERFTAIYRYYRRGFNKPCIIAAIVDGREVEVSGLQFYNFNAFRACALEQCGIYLAPCPKEQWEELVRRRIEEDGAEWR